MTDVTEINLKTQLNLCTLISLAKIMKADRQCLLVNTRKSWTSHRLLVETIQ